MDRKPIEVVIVGGSLAGLATAVAIKSIPHVTKITILERLPKEKLQDLGAGIRVTNEAIEAIRQYMQLPPEKYAAKMEHFRMLSRDGGVLNDMPVKGWTSTWGQLYRIYREEIDTEDKIEYCLECTVTAVQEKDDSTLVLHYTDRSGEIESIEAQLVVGADGASSALRSIMLPQVERTITGYVLYRGVIPKQLLSDDAAKVYDNAATFSLPAQTGQFTSYAVPSNEAPADEAIECVNWVLYHNMTPEDLKEVLTDKDGKTHRYSLPPGGMRRSEVEKLVRIAKAELPPVHIEVIEKTVEPFVQVITDSLATSNTFLGGKLLLVGDAVGGQRPHTAASIMQNTQHGLLLRALLEGQIDLQTWSTETYQFSKALVEEGLNCGQRLMIERAPAQAKLGPYMQTFMAAQRRLSEIWLKTVAVHQDAGKL